jgi:Phage integrase family.
LGNIILVNIPNTKTKKHRSFTIIGEFYLNLYRKYATLRPKDITFDRFFIKYQNGHCHRVVMGIHKISKVPKDVASFLRLPNPHEYTGHCLRRTSATILVDNGGDITTLKRHGGWKSTSVAEGYIEDSVNNKKQIAMKILNPLEYNEPSTSSETVNIDPENNLIEDFSVNNGTIVNTETENLITK